MGQNSREYYYNKNGTLKSELHNNTCSRFFFENLIRPQLFNSPPHIKLTVPSFVHRFLPLVPILIQIPTFQIYLFKIHCNIILLPICPRSLFPSSYFYQNSVCIYHMCATCPTYPIHLIFIKVGSTTFRTLLHSLLPFPVTSSITSQHSLQHPQLISFQ